MNLLSSLVEAWNINCRVTLAVLDHLPDEALAATLSTRGGRRVYDQLAHLHNVRLSWLEHHAGKAALGDLIPLTRDEHPDRNRLRGALEASGAAQAALLARAVENEGQVKGFKRDVVSWLGYTIAHEAHHRGNILLTARQCGFKLPDELKWNIWDWGKI
ncbi:MAG TPA: DinB family protein [Saprospiraceae bacterium]|nr:DinB family protein [Saprospiraceae bacterium]